MTRLMEHGTRSSHTQTTYWRHDRYWIPRDHAPAQRFYLNRLLVPNSRRQFLRAMVARALPGQAGTALARFAAHNGHPDGAPDFQELVRMMEDPLQRAGLIGTGPLSCVALEDSHRSARGQLLLFLFGADGARPCAVVKLTTQAAQQAVLRHEFTTLSELRPRLTEPLRSTLPRPIALTERQGMTVLVETHVPGRSIYVELRGQWHPRRLARRHFHLARTWLAQFHRQTGSVAARLDEPIIQEMVRAPLEQFQQRCRPSPCEEQMIRHMLKAAQRLRGERLPLVVRQGDFWPRNLLLHGQTVGVVDWERTQPRSTPFADLLMFATTYGFSYPWRWGSWVDQVVAFSATYLQRTWLSQLIRTTALAYCRDMELSPALLEVFFPVFLVERALEEHEKHPTNGSQVRIWRNLIQEYAWRGGSVCFG